MLKKLYKKQIELVSYVALATYIIIFPHCSKAIDTDRPDFTETANVVAPEHFQIETGYTFTYDHSHIKSKSSHTLPESLIRIGLVEDTELRLNWPGYEKSTLVDQHRLEGFSDLDIGAKTNFIRTDRYLLSLIYAVTMPVGTEDMTQNQISPYTKLLWEYDLGASYDLSGNINLMIGEINGDLNYQHSYSIALGKSFAYNIRLYGELYTIQETAKYLNDEDYFNIGIAWEAIHDVQLDGRIGSGLNKEADDLFMGVGLSVHY